jgi:Phytanoyl-CoA dioxygenase (PhyH)/SEC-C motif
MLPTIRFTDEEIARRELNPDRVEFARAQFLLNGCLLLENAVDPGLIDRLRAEFLERYASYLEDRPHSDALEVGNKRFMVTVGLSGVFNDPNVYAPPLVYPLIAAMLDAKFILCSFGGVVALPGSADQHMHRDMILFDGQELGRIPPFAVTAVLPLVALNPVTGATRLYPGSHRLPVAEIKEFTDPVAAPGACILMDYTLMHGGKANRSNTARPILYNVYSRRWFRDSDNYRRQSPLDMDEEARNSVPPPYRHLFAAAPLAGAGPNAPNLGRNVPCPCRSGKRFKHCHGALSVP